MFASILVVCFFIKSISSECVTVNSSATCSSVSRLGEIPLKGIKKLKIDNNFQPLSVSSGAIDDGEDLEQLYIIQSRFQILYANIFRNISLTHLILRNNSIEEVRPGAFNQLPKLQVLDLTENNIEIIRRGVFSNLTVNTLRLSENQITTIEDNAFENLPNLKKLFLEINQLEEVFVPQILDHPETLEVLRFHANKLTRVSNYMLQGLTNLRLLNLGYNRITSIEQGSFQQTPNLQTLVLANNNIKEIDGTIFPRQGHNHLERLYLDNNELMFLPSSFFLRLNALKRITLVGNPWQCDCLESAQQILRENEIVEKCQKEYVKGNRPVCVNESPGERCRYSYNEKLAAKYLEYKKTYPLFVRPIDCVL